jgi:hypothetical protein
MGTTRTMLNSLNARWDVMLKHMVAGLYRWRPAVATPLLSFPAKRQKKLGWTLYLCGRGR